MLATEGLVVSGIGLVVGLALGWLMSLVLIFVVNRQSFHWSMDCTCRGVALLALAVVLLVLATATTLRQRARGDERQRRPRGEGRLVKRRSVPVRIDVMDRASVAPLALAAPPVRRGTLSGGVAGHACSNFRATTAAIRNFAPSGGTSPRGCAIRTDSDLGVQITFFRNRPGVAEDSASRFAPPQLLFAHAAIADPRSAGCSTTSAPRAQASAWRKRQDHDRRAHRRLVAAA